MPLLPRDSTDTSVFLPFLSLSDFSLLVPFQFGLSNGVVTHRYFCAWGRAVGLEALMGGAASRHYTPFP